MRHLVGSENYYHLIYNLIDTVAKMLYLLLVKLMLSRMHLDVFWHAGRLQLEILSAILYKQKKTHS